MLEPVVAYLLLGANLANNPLRFGQAYNIGPHLSDALPVKDMLKLAIARWGKGNYIVDQVEGQLF